MSLAAVQALPLLSTTPSVSNGFSRTDNEIDAELFRLYGLELRTPSRNEYGECVAEAIRAQVEVLRGRLTPEEAGERYEVAPLFVLSEALNAADWLRDNGESLSVSWVGQRWN